MSMQTAEQAHLSDIRRAAETDGWAEQRIAEGLRWKFTRTAHGRDWQIVLDFGPGGRLTGGDLSAVVRMPLVKGGPAVDHFESQTQINHRSPNKIIRVLGWFK
jgi:hypothetical protein